MNKTVSKHRKKLNAEQLEVLELLYKFRFASNNLIADYFGKKDRSFVFKRLTILLEQGLIGKRFDSSYRIQGKPAAYYLTPAGARVIQATREPEDNPINIKAIYKDKTVKDDFVQHCFDIFAAYNHLSLRYGNKLKFFTKANLNYEQYDYFPKPLPDAYIRLKTKAGEKQFFLDIYHDSQPFFAAVRRIKQYIAFEEEADWSVTETDISIILVVCESASLQKRLKKRIISSLNQAWGSELVFALTTKTELFSEESKIWQLADESDEPVSLSSI